MSHRILWKYTFFLILTVIAMTSISCNPNPYNLEDGLYASIITARGDIIIELFPDKSPLTVMNFVGLAEGSLDFTNKNGPFYNGLKFHRVIENFMIQGGDPQGTGSGGPGYSFRDETDNGLIFDKPGILAMANSGPNTNGSQFFITHVVTDWLNARHTIFGQVKQGQEIVNAIEQDDIMKEIKIMRIGTKASNYKADSDTFKTLEKNLEQQAQAIREEKMKDILNEIANRWPGALFDETTGIYNLIRTEGAGPLPNPGSRITVHYTGTLMDGTRFDSSRDRDDPFQFIVGKGQVIPGWDVSLLQMKKGERRIIILPPEMGYGSRGIGPIPADSWLVFDVELIDFQDE